MEQVQAGVTGEGLLSGSEHHEAGGGQRSPRAETVISRRDMIRRSTVVGGALAVSAPAMLTFTRPAFASTGVGAVRVKLRKQQFRGNQWREPRPPRLEEEVGVEFPASGTAPIQFEVEVGDHPAVEVTCQIDGDQVTIHVSPEQWPEASPEWRAAIVEVDLDGEPQPVNGNQATQWQGSL